MRYCLTFSVRHRTPLHFCFPSKSDATNVLKEFASDVLRANDDELVLVQDVAAFLKRSFVSVELDDYSDDDGNDDKSEEAGVVVPPTGGEESKQRRRRRRSKGSTSLEADLDRIVGSMRDKLKTA